LQTKNESPTLGPLVNIYFIDADLLQPSPDTSHKTSISTHQKLKPAPDHIYQFLTQSSDFNHFLPSEKAEQTQQTRQFGVMESPFVSASRMRAIMQLVDRNSPSARAKEDSKDLQVSLQPHEETLAEFRPFGKLPTELRHAIWRQAESSAPRVVISSSGYSIPVPTLLHTCSESRVVSLVQYELVALTNTSSPGKVYIDFIKDTITVQKDKAPSFEGFGQFYVEVNCDFLARVKHLSLPYSIISNLLCWDFCRIASPLLILGQGATPPYFGPRDDIREIIFNS
jgi:hypothetical protein